MKRVVVLGAGLVGAPMALDLAKENEFEVLAVDFNEQNFLKLKKAGIQTKKIDLSAEGAIESIISDADFVINATPGFMGFESLRRIINSRKNCIDIAFYPENMFDLDELAKEKGVVVISDIGVAPGMSNLLSAYCVTLLDKAEDIKIYVGGLPIKRELPWEYKAPFSPVDVIEEYTRPARYVVDGQVVTKAALTEGEIINFPIVGELEAFNSDGLRSLMYTLDVPNMIEKTLRYPNYIDKIKLLRDSGFFDTEKRIINGIEISPIELTSNLLFDQWKLEDDDKDLTVMQIIVSGIKDGKAQTHVFDLYDEHESITNIHSMARTTGYTATVALRLLDAELYKETGVSAPEALAVSKVNVDFMLNGLKQRGVNYLHTIK
ncbi:MAG: saccharopine dehydrogenase NADP-binding domain-containing protein [Bacteroidales bacterium]|jgi:lysine 6-dehydrogenase|nr:saccharopine dehydrogenase NADP-binding domain-containing protein [Bacteroidales bacterium]